MFAATVCYRLACHPTFNGRRTTLHCLSTVDYQFTLSRRPAHCNIITRFRRQETTLPLTVTYHSPCAGQILSAIRLRLATTLVA